MASRGQMVMSDMIKEVQALVSTLKIKNEVADDLVVQGNNVTSMLDCMKEYNTDLNAVNSYLPTEGRVHLVARLQHENRQILALQEENRQLQFAVTEMERTMEDLMNAHRKMVHEYRASHELMKLLNLLEAQPQLSADRNVMEMCQFAAECIENGNQQANRFKEVITTLHKENQVLKELLKISGTSTVNDIGYLKKSTTDQELEPSSETAKTG